MYEHPPTKDSLNLQKKKVFSIIAVVSHSDLYKSYARLNRHESRDLQRKELNKFQQTSECFDATIIFARSYISQYVVVSGYTL